MDNLLLTLIRIRDYYTLQVEDYNIEIPWGEPNIVSDDLDSLIEELTIKKETHMLYPATIEEIGEGFQLTFRDLPEVTSVGSSITDVLQQASMDLSFAIDGYERRPSPSLFRHGDIAIYFHIGK